MINTLQSITALSQLLGELDQAILKKEVELIALKKQRQSISEVDIPELMAEAEAQSIKLTNGFTVSVSPSVIISILAEHRPAAYDWFDKNGYGAIIKTEVQTSFPKGGLRDAIKLQQQLNSKFPGAVKLDRSIHPSTLRAWAMERYNAHELTPEFISTYFFSSTKLTPPKTER